MVEQGTHNPCVRGSNPCAATRSKRPEGRSFFLLQWKPVGSAVSPPGKRVRVPRPRGGGRHCAGKGARMDTKAFMGAVGAALLGAAIWGGIAYLTGYEVGYVAWGIGFIVGFGAKALGAKGHTAGVICAGLALLSIFTGKMFTLRMVVGNEVEKAARQHLTQEVYRTVQRDAADFALVESEDAYPAFMASHGYSKSQNPAEVTKKELVEFKRASAPRLREFQKEQPDFHAWRRAAVDAAMAEISLPGLLRDSLHPFDLLFAFLGIVTAFRVVTVKREVPPPEPAAAE